MEHTPSRRVERGRSTYALTAMKKILVLLLLLPSTAFAQPHWKIVASFPGPAMKNFFPYFINCSYGFVYTAEPFERIFPGQPFTSYADSAYIFRTTDGGVSWTSTNFPQITPGRFQELYFENPKHGFIRFLGLDGNPPIAPTSLLYETTDSGMNWKQISDVGFWASRSSLWGLYYFDSVIYVPGYVSTNNGQTWINLDNRTIYNCLAGNEDTVMTNREVQTPSPPNCE